MLKTNNSHNFIVVVQIVVNSDLSDFQLFQLLFSHQDNSGPKTQSNLMLNIQTVRNPHTAIFSCSSKQS